MNISQSFRQTIAEARNNPGFTALYIGGVAFAVAFTMVYVILYYIRIAPIYPEYNRDTTLYINNVTIRNDETSSQSTNNIGLPLIDEYISNLKNYEYITVNLPATGTFLQPTDGSGDLKALKKGIDPAFFKLYGYEFINGRPLSQAEFDSGVSVAIITKDLADRLYGSAENAVGKPISMNYRDFKIIGVIKPGSSIFDKSFAQILYPYTSDNWYNKNQGSEMKRFLGQYTLGIKVKDNEQRQAFKDELDDMLRRINASDTTGWRAWFPSVATNAESVFSSCTQTDDSSKKGIAEKIKPYLTLLFVLLIIPAINISGIIGGQMDRRMSEMGIRRSFGGTKSALCRQVMFENLLLTITGGIVGLIAAWSILYICHGWILGLIDNSWSYLGDMVEAKVSLEMLFAPSIFITALSICIIMNIISAYIPVRLALRKQIVSSINEKK